MPVQRHATHGWIHPGAKAVYHPAIGWTDPAGNVYVSNRRYTSAEFIQAYPQLRDIVFSEGNRAATLFGAGGQPGDLTPKAPAPAPAPAAPAALPAGQQRTSDGGFSDTPSSTVYVPGLGWVNRHGWVYVTATRQTVPMTALPQWQHGSVQQAAARAGQLFPAGGPGDRPGTPSGFTPMPTAMPARGPTATDPNSFIGHGFGAPSAELIAEHQQRNQIAAQNPTWTQDQVMAAQGYEVIPDTSGFGVPRYRKLYPPFAYRKLNPPSTWGQYPSPAGLPPSGTDPRVLPPGPTARPAPQAPVPVPQGWPQPAAPTPSGRSIMSFNPPSAQGYQSPAGLPPSGTDPRVLPPGPPPRPSPRPAVDPSTVAGTPEYWQDVARRDREAYEYTLRIRQEDAAQRAAARAADPINRDARAYVGAIGSPQQWNARNFMRLFPSSQQFLVGAAQEGGYAPEDTLEYLRRSLPQFVPPRVGRII